MPKCTCQPLTHEQAVAFLLAMLGGQVIADGPARPDAAAFAADWNAAVYDRNPKATLLPPGTWASETIPSDSPAYPWARAMRSYPGRSRP